ncbi:MAG TPA: hypothetical protein VN770_06140 [Gaiellaceae bacterium]|nr:hypothetical protein [Gaiellaceae bacterium]
MSTGTTRRRARLVLVASAAAAALALLAAGAPVASAAPAATTQATSKCWLQVVNDWLHHGKVTGYYAIPCYTQAIQNLSAYPDISQYSSAIDDIKQALQAALHQDRGNGFPTGGNSSGGNSSGGGAIGGGGSSSGGSTPGGHGQGVLAQLAHDIGPGNAQSIPLPLLVLGGLGLLLLLTAAATWFTRRLQSRRMTPAPAHARAGSSVRPEP